MGPTILGLGQILLSPICTVLSTFWYLFCKGYFLFRGWPLFTGWPLLQRVPLFHRFLVYTKTLELETDAVERWFAEHFGDAAAVLQRLHDWNLGLLLVSFLFSQVWRKFNKQRNTSCSFHGIAGCHSERTQGLCFMNTFWINGGFGNFHGRKVLDPWRFRC